MTLESVFEGWVGDLFPIERAQEIVDFMDEQMFVSDDVCGRPPVVGVGMAWIGGVDLAEALNVAGIGVVVILEDIHVLKVPGDGSFAAVNLERVVVAAPGGKSCRFECRECVGPRNAANEHRRVVNIDEAFDFAIAELILAGGPDG